MLKTFLLITLALTALAQAQDSQPPAPDADFAQHCGVDIVHLKPTYFFRDGAGGWRSYKKWTPALEPALADKLVTQWRDGSGAVYARVDEPGEDMGTTQHNCFSQTGDLRTVRFELESQNGWRYIEAREYASPTQAKRKVKFVDAKTGAEIEKPPTAEAVQQFLKPTIYKNLKQAPWNRTSGSTGAHPIHAVSSKGPPSQR